jgi:hypothetical protein
MAFPSQFPGINLEQAATNEINKIIKLLKIIHLDTMQYMAK